MTRTARTAMNLVLAALVFAPMAYAALAQATQIFA
jgi:hypothetical protein